MTPKLNIPNKKDQFEYVSFVKKMTPHQLKVLVKRLFLNFHELANALDQRDSKVSLIIDSILSGDGWNEDSLGERYQYIFYNGETLAFDTLTKSFSIMHKNGSVTTLDAMTRKEIDALHKRITKK
jgi:hypothetical protein